MFVEQLHVADSEKTATPGDAGEQARATPGGADAVEASGGCPPPLEWQEVLREFHRQADNWYLDRPHVRISGRTLGNGPPLYFLNGFSGTHELYALLVWLLRDDYRCVLFDYALPAARGQTTLDDLAGDVAAVADAAGDRQFDLFAPTFGGLVALTAARRFPERVGRLVLQGAFARLALAPVERLLIRLCLVHPGRLRHLPGRSVVQRASHRRWFPPFDQTRWQFLADNTGSVRLADLARRAAIVRDTDLRTTLHDVTQPTLLIRTEGQGRGLEACCTELAGGLPHAQVEWLPETGLFPYLTHPHRLAKLIRGFLPGP
jgi:pimeloyl-ACP methyl ester carboxylesterase